MKVNSIPRLCASDFETSLVEVPVAPHCAVPSARVHLHHIFLPRFKVFTSQYFASSHETFLLEGFHEYFIYFTFVINSHPIYTVYYTPYDIPVLYNIYTLKFLVSSRLLDPNRSCGCFPKLSPNNRIYPLRGMYMGTLVWPDV